MWRRSAASDYYNDSKATNVDATIKALESFPANIHLILGGKDKGSDYSVLNDLLRERVKRVYTIGAAAAKIESQIVRRKRGPELVHAETLENAIRKADAAAQPGDIVLLAPACASFDQFKSYEHRGQSVQGNRAKSLGTPGSLLSSERCLPRPPEQGEIALNFSCCRQLHTPFAALKTAEFPGSMSCTKTSNTESSTIQNSFSARLATP